jgi:hypothetical protein
MEKTKMKRISVALMVVLLVYSLCGCLPQTGETPSDGSARPSPALTGVGAAGSASPTVAASPAVSITAQDTPGSSVAPAGQRAAEKAMKRDLDFLIANSEYQRGQDENYKNVGKEQLITIESVTEKEIKFTGKTQVFSGDYTGQFTAGKSYTYFEDASMGGKRYYNVKDNFGVWIVFKYTVPF